MPKWFHCARIAVAVAVCATLPLMAATLQTAPSGSLETLEVRPSFFVIAGDGSNVGVHVGDDGVVVVDAGSAAGAPSVLAAL